MRRPLSTIKFLVTMQLCVDIMCTWSYGTLPSWYSYAHACARFDHTRVSLVRKMGLPVSKPHSALGFSPFTVSIGIEVFLSFCRRGFQVQNYSKVSLSVVELHPMMDNAFTSCPAAFAETRAHITVAYTLDGKKFVKTYV